MQKILIIQTAFIGDVILATPVLEALHEHFPNAKIDFLLRKGNEALLRDHPFLNELIIWNKKEQKRQHLLKTIRYIRSKRYDLVVNLQRFFSTGLITAFSKGSVKVGFDKNPFSMFFDIKKSHFIRKDKHEVDRNLSLIDQWIIPKNKRPKLYPSAAMYQKAADIRATHTERYICIAPTSVWFTKQFPAQKWIELTHLLPEKYTIYLLGAPNDKVACEQIRKQSNHKNIVNLAGQLSLLESAALMQHAQMNYVNDSAPLHLCSAMNAPVKAIFCSTVPDFGFTPLSNQSEVIETRHILPCRPCGLHGFKSCPKGHFKCADIDVNRLSIS